MKLSCRNVSSKNFLEDYAATAQQTTTELEKAALRTGSLAMREVFAHAASGGSYSSSEVLELVLDGQLEELELEGVAKLARVCALQNVHESDRALALSAFNRVNAFLPKKPRYRRFHKLEVELLVAAGRMSEAEAALEENSDLRRYYHGYLPCDLNNPYMRGQIERYDEWIHAFNAPFEDSGLQPVSVRQGYQTPFDRLQPSKPPIHIDSGPLVSIILTSFNPDPDAFLTSVVSVLEQTWRNLELLIIDDGSDESKLPLLHSAEALDTRVRLHRSTINGGTYHARNIGLKLARGKYVTGQDADDWSHPQRIERQVALLEADPQCPAVQAFALRTSPALTHTFTGYVPFVQCASTYMLSTALAQEVGGYIETRKAADNEFRHRVETYSGCSTQMLKEPLMLIRIAEVSLSRGDFAPGWQHPARVAFSSSYTHWHKFARRDDLRLKSELSPPIAVPSRLTDPSAEVTDLDVVFAGDWTMVGNPQITMLDEIESLLQSGYRIGVMHLESASVLTKLAKPPLADRVQELINSRTISQVLPDEPACIELMICRYPPVLQFPPFEPVAASISRLLIVADEMPADRDGNDIRYVPSDCADNAEELFGLRGTWAPQDCHLRKTLRRALSASEIAAFDMPGIVETEDWFTDRSYFRSNRPIIGFHSRASNWHWPDDPSVIEAVYPRDGSAEVRIMGDTRMLLDTLGVEHLPAEWVAFDSDEMPARTFLNGIDFFVHIQSETSYTIPNRTVLEAIASGCVVILPRCFRQAFGQAAIYAEPGDISNIIEDFYSDPIRFRHQSHQARTVVQERFGYKTYVALISNILSHKIPHPGSPW